MQDGVVRVGMGYGQGAVVHYELPVGFRRQGEQGYDDRPQGTAVAHDQHGLLGGVARQQLGSELGHPYAGLADGFAAGRGKIQVLNQGGPVQIRVAFRILPDGQPLKNALVIFPQLRRGVQGRGPLPQDDLRRFPGAA